jgi:thiol-disulfide isomerase/thioredoxin
MKKYLNKDNLDYLILALGVVLIFVSIPLNVVVNHYMHSLYVPATIIVVCYGIYVIAKRSMNAIKWQDWYKWVGLGVGLLLVVVWALSLKQPSQRAYLGTGAIVVKSESDIKQVEIASDVKGYPYILFFNPNCETCQDTIPELLKGLDKDIYKKNIVFVDTTQEYGKKLASKNGVETVPSYLYNDGYGEPVKLAYHTDEGTKFLNKKIGYLRESIKHKIY